MNESKKISLVMSGGGPAGVFIQFGLLKVLHEYLEARNEKIANVTGTSAGALVGAFYAIDPTKEGLNNGTTKMLNTKTSDVFGKLYEVKRKWNEFLFFAAPSQTDGFLDGEKYMKFLESLFGLIKVSETKIGYKALGYDIVEKEPVIYDSSDVRDFVYLKTAVYVSSAQPPEIPPLAGRYVDGGIIAPLPIALALKDDPDEIWVFNVTRANRRATNIKGLRDIVTESIDGLVAENIKQSLNLLPAGEQLKVHLVDGSDYPEIGNDFLAGFEHKEALYNYGIKTMTEYLNNLNDHSLKI